MADEFIKVKNTKADPDITALLNRVKSWFTKNTVLALAIGGAVGGVGGVGGTYLLMRSAQAPIDFANNRLGTTIGDAYDFYYCVREEARNPLSPLNSYSSNITVSNTGAVVQVQNILRDARGNEDGKDKYVAIFGMTPTRLTYKIARVPEGVAKRSLHDRRPDLYACMVVR